MNEKSCTHPPIMFVEDSMDSRPFVHQFAKKVFVELLLSLSKRKGYFDFNFVLLSILLFTIIQSILVVARGPQCCFLFAFFSALPSWLLSRHLFFSISSCKITNRFYYDNVLYSRLFLTERPFYFNSPVTTYPRNFVTTIYSLHMTHEYWPLLFL